jgi:hypothetical protein
VTVRPCRGDEVDAVLHLWRDAEAVPSATDDPTSVRALIDHDGNAVLVAEGERRLRERGARRFSALVISEHGSAVGFREAAGYVRDGRVGRFAKTLGER